MRFLRILPAVWPRISWPFSRRTRNMALGSSSTTWPRISSNSSLAKRSLFVWGKKSRSLTLHVRQRKGGGNSDGENRRSGRPAALQRAVGLRRFGQREPLLNLDLHLAAGDNLEQLARALLELRARRDVVKQR